MNLFSHVYSEALTQTTAESVDLELKALALLARMEATGIAFDLQTAQKMISNVQILLLIGFMLQQSV